MEIDDLVGLRVLITGASSGIGAAAAVALASCGAEICVHYNRNESAARTLVDTLRSGKGTAHLVQGDVTSRADVTRLVERSLAAMGGMDCLINNAGAIERTPVGYADDDMYERVFDLNTRSILRMVRAACPSLRESGRASIINLGSIAGRTGGGMGSGIYSAAKAAVHSLTRSLARELAGDGIRVNAVAPWVILTPFHEPTPKEFLDAARQSVPLGRLGTAQDCAWAFAFLASPTMSGYITGQILDINGGQLMP